MESIQINTHAMMAQRIIKQGTKERKEKTMTHRFFMVLELDSWIHLRLIPVVTIYTMKKIEQVTSAKYSTLYNLGLHYQLS